MCIRQVKNLFVPAKIFCIIIQQKFLRYLNRRVNIATNIYYVHPISSTYIFSFQISVFARGYSGIPGSNGIPGMPGIPGAPGPQQQEGKDGAEGEGPRGMTGRKGEKKEIKGHVVIMVPLE